MLLGCEELLFEVPKLSMWCFRAVDAAGERSSMNASLRGVSVGDVLYAEEGRVLGGKKGSKDCGVEKIQIENAIVPTLCSSRSLCVRGR